jgi:hypothetical protein
MNIFVLSFNVDECAVWHNDRHVCKQIIEAVQLLCGAFTYQGLDAPYKLSKSHLNHPCAIWTRQSLANWVWLYRLVEALNNEWKYRYEHTRNHKCYDVAKTLPTPNLKDISFTKPANVTGGNYDHLEITEAYKNYYMNEKAHLATWKKRDKPEWFC